MDEFARNSTADDVVAGSPARYLGGGDRDDRTQPFAAGNDEVRGDLREIGIWRLHSGVDLSLDAFEILVHRHQGQSGDTSGATDTAPRYPRRDARAAWLIAHRPGMPHSRMTTPGTRRDPICHSGRAAAVTIGAAGDVARRAPPPTVPPGYVQLVDDTGLLTVAVPDTWTDIDTVPGSTADGAVPWISASPDLEVYETTFDVPGVRTSPSRSPMIPPP